MPRPQTGVAVATQEFAGHFRTDIISLVNDNPRFTDVPLVELSAEEAKSGTTKNVWVSHQGERKIVAFRIPAGIRDNSLLRLPGRGQPDPAGGPPADLFVRVRVDIPAGSSTTTDTAGFADASRPGWRVVPHALAGTAVLAGITLGDTRYALALGGIWLLVAFCARYTKVRRDPLVVAEPPATTGLRYNLAAFAVLYMIPIGIAVAFHVLLSAYLSVAEDSLSIGRLMAMQRGFAKVSAFFSDNLKLSELKVFAVLVVLYLLSCLLLSRRRQRDMDGDGGSSIRVRVVGILHRLVNGYTRCSGPIAAGLATLAAFTFFGMHLGEPSKDLELRIKITQEGYADLAQRTEAELAGQVATKLYAKVKDSFPPSYRDALQLQAQVDQVALAIGARPEYRVSDPIAARVLREEAARAKRVDELNADPHAANPDRRDAPESTAGRQVDAAREALGARSGGRRIELLREGGKQVLLQVEKLVSEQLTKLIKPLTEAVPILEPLLQTFVEAVDKTFQDKMAAAYDRTVNTAMHDPDDLAAAIDREAETIVAATDVKPLVDRAAPRAQQKAERLRRALSVLRAGAADVERQARVDHRAADRLISRLASQNANIRVQASRQLIDMGRRLSGPNVDRLLDMMRSKAVAARHAAYVVEKVESPHVLLEQRAEAKRISCGCR